MPPIYLDHIVILLPHAHVLSPPPYLTKNFTITPGGIHAGGQTENKLVIFEDGSYIELIAFVNDDPALRAGHRWGDKEVRIIDFALSSDEPAGQCFEGVGARLEAVGKGDGKGVRYEEPIDGGRKRDDGRVLRWEVTPPEPSVKRGELPFFCHDVTPRELRVPREREWITHPCQATGVGGLTIYVPKERVGKLRKAYPAILGVKDGGGEEGVFEIGFLKSVEGRGKAVLRVIEPVDEGKRTLVAERGVLLDDLEILVNGSMNDTKSKIRFNVGI